MPDVALVTPDKVAVRWGVRIPLRDGEHLSATLYRPIARDVAPTVFTLTPYIAQTYHDRAMYFAAHGFGFLCVDTRGRGNSSGTFRAFIQEAADAYDATEWIAAQDFCNGKVAMWGGSYGGYAQWAAASAAPPHLCAIAPVASPCLGVDFPGRSNMPLPYIMQWLMLVWGKASQDKLFWNNHSFWSAQFRRAFEHGAALSQLDEIMGAPSPQFQEWLAHPERGAFWDAYNPSEADYARIAIPVLTITGAYDGDQPGALQHYRQHRRRSSNTDHHLIIGPWDHGGTRTPQKRFCGVEMGDASLLDLNRLHADWYRWRMESGPKPEFLQNEVAYYVAGADVWRYADNLDEVTGARVPLYLQSDVNPSDVFSSGRMTSAPSACPPAHYVYDPRDTSLAARECDIDPEDRGSQKMVHSAAGKHLVYHSAPLAADIDIAGFFRFHAWLAIDRPDTDFLVSIYEIDLDGASVLLSNDAVRARHREGLNRSVLIETTDALPYDFNAFTFIARRVRRGHRLRLVLGPAHSIYRQKNYNSADPVALQSMKDAQTVHVRLLQNNEQPALLEIPIDRASPNSRFAA